MKKLYFSPITEYTIVVNCGIICGLSGTNDSGSGLVGGGGGSTGGSGSGGWQAPRRGVF